MVVRAYLRKRWTDEVLLRMLLEVARTLPRKTVDGGTSVINEAKNIVVPLWPFDI